MNEPPTESDCPSCGKYIPDLFEVAAGADHNGFGYGECPYCDAPFLLETYHGWTLSAQALPFGETQDDTTGFDPIPGAGKATP